MKVERVNEAFKFTDRVNEKHSADSQSQHQNQDQNEQKKDQSSETYEVTEEKVKAAMLSFDKDAQAKANGLHVDQQGVGPGLKVVLKDESGRVIRQFTGEEFLKMREAVHHGDTKRGKILDQKL